MIHVPNRGSRQDACAPANEKMPRTCGCTRAALAGTIVPRTLVPGARRSEGSLVVRDPRSAGDAVVAVADELVAPSDDALSTTEFGCNAAPFAF